MTGPAQAYARATAIVEQAIAEIDSGNDKSRAAYMLARAALLRVRGLRGGQEAARMAYQLADEFSTLGHGR